METLNVYLNNRLENSICGTIDRFGNFRAGDAFGHSIIINTWADAMNYLNTDGGRTMGNGLFYYNSIDDAAEDFGGDLELAQRVLKPSQVAELCAGKIEIEE